MLIEWGLVIAFLADSENIIVSRRCHAYFLRRKNIVLTTQSIEFIDQGLFEARRHIEPFSLNDLPECAVNRVTSQACCFLFSSRGIVEPVALFFHQNKKLGLGLHEFLVFLSYLLQSFSLGSIGPSTSRAWTIHGDATCEAYHMKVFSIWMNIENLACKMAVTI
jgi:hypothetical protein